VERAAEAVRRVERDLRWIWRARVDANRVAYRRPAGIRRGLAGDEYCVCGAVVDRGNGCFGL